VGEVRVEENGYVTVVDMAAREKEVKGEKGKKEVKKEVEEEDE